jgi:hypothetical protein
MLYWKMYKINYKNLFLIDSIGALLSALMLIVLFVGFETTFGVLSKVVYFLAIIPCVFSLYSFIGFLGKVQNWRHYMKIIAIANLLYCCLTLGLVFYFHQDLSIWGITYFILEIITVTILATIELKVAFR